MAQAQHTSSLARLEEAMIVLFCLIDEAYYTLLNPRSRRHESPSGSRTRRSSPWRSCSNFGAWSRNAPSCGMPSGSFRTCSRG
jgi:hypothetical protein